ncbi:hypothetical protein PT974_10434 [Cladobotryum mycophilum]|uniref:Aminoglycoside phosphotransferase domain-containing protein n=1 Tax=Cladobotryum mycophilum TaxID=491253 RepID=A0ABR0SAQ7_9HYPO
MGEANNKAHLPPALSEDAIRALITSLRLPCPEAIEPVQVTAEFHSIYFVHFAGSCAEEIAEEKAAAVAATAAAANEDGSVTLVLRVSGGHVPRRKTANEVAVMKWIREHSPSIPVPAVVRFDDSSDNAIGHEFTLLEKARGTSVDRMYPTLDEEAKLRLVRQLTDVLVEMNRHEWHHVGGLRLNGDGDGDGDGVVPGPVLEDTFWFAPDIADMWPEGESIDSLNPGGPYDSHSDFVRGYLGCFVHAIGVHSSLAWLRDLIPRLNGLMAKVPSLADSLDSTRLVLAHKDLHFANVMATPEGRLTAILDWEFATVVPALRWDPVRAFLWNGRYSDEASAEKERLRGLFERELEERGVPKWWGREEGGEEGTDVVETVWTVVRFVRALVEVCPRGQRADKVEEWKRAVEEALAKLGV